MIKFDIPVAIAVAVACLPIFYSGRRIDRWEGFFFLFYYVIYTAYLVLNATQAEVLPTYVNATLWFVLPLTIITLAIVSVREKRAANKRRKTG